MPEEKKFEACLLRTENGLFIVAEWDQLATVASKSKLRVGSCVGYRKSNKRREKIIRGTILIIGKSSLCEKQKTLLMSKAKGKQTPTTNTDENIDSEDESVDIPTDKALLNSSHENSSDSSEVRLHIDEEEEKENDDPKEVHLQQKDNNPNVVHIQEKDNNPKVLHKQQKDRPSNVLQKEHGRKSLHKSQKDRVSNFEQKETGANLLPNQQKDVASNDQQNETESNLISNQQKDVGSDTQPVDNTTQPKSQKDATASSQSNAEQGQKRKNSDIIQRDDFDDNDRSQPPKRKFVSISCYNDMKAENDKLKRRISTFESNWMPRPTDPAVIRYITRMGELLSTDNQVNEEKGDRLADICALLHLSEIQLQRLRKENGTKTTRSIVRAFFPLETRLITDPEDIGDDFREAIHDYVGMFHSMEGLTKGKINESINNVFRSAKSQQRRHISDNE